MRLSIFRINLFAKYREKIEERNTKGIYGGGIIFLAVFVLDYIIKLILNPGGINYFFIFYMLIDVAFLALFRIFGRKIRKAVTIMCFLWYLLGFIVVGHIQFMYPENLAIIEYAAMAIPLSVLILVEPFYLIMGQIFGAGLISVSVYYTQGGIISGMDMSKIIIVCLLSIISGMITTYIRIEDLVFDSEVAFFAGSEDDDFVAEYSDGAWSGRNKYGILSGELASKRRVFSFIFNISKDFLSHIREVNVFKLKEGMNWEQVKDQMMSMALDPGSKVRLAKFLDVEAIKQAYKAEKRRFSVIAGFTVDETERIWLDIECILKTHPVSGELLASIVLEDITEERILMGVLNKIVEQNYDYVMCVERKLNRTITFGVKPGQEIRGTYGEVYNVEMGAYIREHVDAHDVERAFRLTNLEMVNESIHQNGMHEFLLDEKEIDGSIRKKLFRFSYMDPGGNFLIVLKQDVTEVIRKEDEAKDRLSKALREKEAAMNARSEFLTRMSHEMRTPMNAILGLSSLMKDEIHNPKLLDSYISKLQYSGRFLLQLINDVLDMSKMEKEKFRINPVPYAFSEFWSSIDMLIGPMCAKKGVDIEWKSAIPGERRVYADPLRLTQIFVNLLSNSVKYTPTGGHIVFECREDKRVGGRVFDTFIVADDGIGMSEEFQTHLYEPFAQESKDVNSDLNGTGLGLAIVKGIVDALDGTIMVESKSGEGSKFTVKLSFDIAGEADGPTVQEKEADLNGKRILVVEDNDINREIAEAVLQKRGIITETAVNGQEAVEMFAAHVPGYYDLILMDIRMPIMGGLTATKRIRSMERDDAETIPIVAMTANAFSKDVEASLDAGMDAHLSKPIEPNLLYSTISKFVS